MGNREQREGEGKWEGCGGKVALSKRVLRTSPAEEGSKRSEKVRVRKVVALLL